MLILYVLSRFTSNGWRLFCLCVEYKAYLPMYLSNALSCLTLYQTFDLRLAAFLVFGFGVKWASCFGWQLNYLCRGRVFAVV